MYQQTVPVLYRTYISYLDYCIARDVVSGLEICAVGVVYFQLVDSVGKVEKAHSDRDESNA
jgi:hypothetical protein